jgi:hypothetical protein
MAKTPSGNDAQSLVKKALELGRRKYQVKDGIVVDTRDGTLRSTGERVHRFRIASAADGNGPQHEVVLSDSGAEVDPIDVEKREGADSLSASIGTAEPAAPGSLPAGGVTITPAVNTLELNPGDTFSETITVTIPANASVPKADVYFLADTTGSMTNILNAVKAGAGTIRSINVSVSISFASVTTGLSDQHQRLRVSASTESHQQCTGDRS